MDAGYVIKKPLLTEKGTMMGEEANAYPFEVAMSADRATVRQALERMFGVEVLGVRTMIVKGKPRRYKRYAMRTKSWKKAIVKLQSGYAIEDFY